VVTRLALCSVVTAHSLEEFLLMKFSFELFHGDAYSWFLRCDSVSYRVLSQHSNILSSTFDYDLAESPDVESPAFRNIVAEKMNALAYAWDSGDWDAVVWLDADLIFTAPTLELIIGLGGQLQLTPHYYPPSNEHLIPIHGYYNSGFVLTRTPEFHRWWYTTFQDNPTQFADQWCLNLASQKFEICQLGKLANIGFWRATTRLVYPPINNDCLFLHVHMFQPLLTPHQWVNKIFGLHCVRFLCASAISEHQVLLREILRLDHHGWYEASLRLTPNSLNSAVSVCG
jgi:hypothetical protein